MHPEIKEEIKSLKESIAHYESELKKPVWNYIFDDEEYSEYFKNQTDTN